MTGENALDCGVCGDRGGGDALCGGDGDERFDDSGMTYGENLCSGDTVGKMGRGEGSAVADAADVGDTNGDEDELAADEDGVVAAAAVAAVVVRAAAAVDAAMAEESRPSWFCRPVACIALH